MLTLSALPVGQWGVVAQVGGEGALRRRLLDMGLTPGVRVFMRGHAPMGDPLLLHLRGFDLSVRREDAALITLNAPGTPGTPPDARNTPGTPGTPSMGEKQL